MKASKEMGILSLKDAAYQGAAAGDRLVDVARYVLDKCPGFLTEVPKEVKEELVAGWAVRWQENNPAKSYSADWVPVAKNGTYDATLAFALSYTQQSFGQLKNSDPLRHKVVGDIRATFQKYCSNRLKDLQTAIRRLNPEGRTRTATDNYDVWVVKALDNILTRCRNAAARGDVTADEVKTRIAIEAFKKSLG